MRKSTETKQNLLDAMIELLKNSNYDSIGVNDICKQAGVTKGCFYHYFETKADLFCSAMDDHWSEFKQKLDALLSPCHSPLEQLELQIQFIIQNQQDHTTKDNPVPICPFFSCSMQSSATDNKIRNKVLSISQVSVKYYVALVRNLQGENLLRESNISAEQLGRMLSQHVQGVLLFGHVYSDIGVIVEDLREGFYRILDLKPEFRLANEKP